MNILVNVFICFLISGTSAAVRNVEPVWFISTVDEAIYKSVYNFSTFDFFLTHNSKTQVTYDAGRGMTIFGISESNTVHHLYRRWDATGVSERFFTLPDPGPYDDASYSPFIIAISAVDPDTRLCYVGMNDIYEVNVDTGASQLLYSGEKEIRFIVRGFNNDLIWSKYTPPQDEIVVGSIAGSGAVAPNVIYDTGNFIYSTTVDQTDGLIYWIQGPDYTPIRADIIQRIQADGSSLQGLGTLPDYVLGSKIRSGYLYMGTISGEIQRIDITVSSNWISTLETVLPRSTTGTTIGFWHIHFAIPNVLGVICQAETYELIPVTFTWDTMEWFAGSSPGTAVSIGTFISADIGTTKSLTATYSMEFDSSTNTPSLHIDPISTTDAGYHAVHYREGGNPANEPSEFYLYVTGVLGSDPTLTLTSGSGSSYDPVTDVATIVDGFDYTFTCLVTDGDEEPTVEFTLSQIVSGDLIETHPSTEAAPNCVTDTLTETITLTAVRAEHDGQELECEASNSAWPTGRFDAITLNVVVPSSVTLFLEPDAANPAALAHSPTVVITTDTDVGSGSGALCLLNGRDYNFRGTTDSVNPGSDFRWTSSANSAPLRLAPGNTISCNPTSCTDVFVLNNVDCATYNEEDLCVEVSNGVSETCVTIKVKVEVQQNNMAITVYRDGATVSRVGGVYELTDGVEYTVECTVTEATPAANADIDLGTNDLGGANNPLGVSDGTSSPTVGGLSSRSGPCKSQDRIGRDTFTANYANHCGEMLTCTAINDANKLIGEGVQTIQVPVRVIVQASNPADRPTITMISSFGGAVTDTYTDGETVDLTSGTGYFFRCASVDAEVIVPDIVWNLVDHSNTADITQIDSDIINSTLNCVLGSNDDDIEVTPDMTYHNHRLECVTSTVGSSLSTYILLNIHEPPEPPDPDSLTMHTGGHDSTRPDNLTPIATTSSTNARTTVAEGDNMEITCWIQDANPSAHITWMLNGVPLDGTDVEVPDGALFDTLATSNPKAKRTDCGHILTCTSIHLETGDTQSVSVEILVEVNPSNVALSINDDEDGTLDDDNAILVEGTRYTFTCSVVSDPEVDVEWTFMDASGDPITALRKLDDNTPDPKGVDCNLQYDKTYILDGNDVTFEDLQSATITCTAGMLSDSMNLRFWKWNMWGPWSDCSVTCDGGTRRRTRSCNDFGSGASCEGSNAQDDPCSLEECPAICERGIVITPYGGLRSPGNQPVGTTHVASEVCPFYTRNEGSPIGSATCVLRSGETFWEWVWDCGGELDFNDTSEERPITPDNVDEMLDMVDDMTRSPDGLGPEDVSNVIKILGDVVDLQLPYRELTDTVIDIVDNLYQVDPDVLMGAQRMNPPTCEVVKIVERQLQNVQVNRPDIGDWPYRRVGNNIAAETYDASNDDICQGIHVATSQGSEASSNGRLTRERQASTNIHAEIDVPGDICNQYPGGTRVVLDVFVGDKLLRMPSLDIEGTNVAQNNFRRVANSPVISVTVGDQEVQNLQKPARLLFTPLEIHANNTECVFFDFNRKDWSSEGCTYLGETPNWQRICECDHLTNFAVVMDIYGGFTITKTHAFILEILTYVGCCLAIIGCSLTLMTYCSSRRLKFKRTNQIFMALTATLMCLYIAFIVLISINIGRGKAELHEVACNVLAGIVHYFTLSSLFWIAVEAYNMYLMFVRVINSSVPNLLLKAAAFAWGVPLIIVATTGAAAQGDYARTDFCFLHTWPLVGGVLAPIGITVVFNIVIFVIVIIRLSRERPRSRWKEKRKVLRVRRVGNAICVMTLMCLAWVIGYLTIIKSVSFLSQMIFCLLNAMLGYVIFMCYCVQQPAVRNHWRQTLGMIRKESRSLGSSTRGRTGRGDFITSML